MCRIITNPQHFWKTEYEIDNSAILFKSVNKRNEQLTWEKIFIYKHAHHIMNFEVPHDSSLIAKYACRSSENASMSSTSIATTCDTVS